MSSGDSVTGSSVARGPVLQSTPAMVLSPGTRLGVYEVTAQLGEGGMGLVFGGHDPRLNRDVALKILPATVASDPDRLARFMREAQTLASLNHPHIAQIDGLEESGGVRTGGIRKHAHAGASGCVPPELLHDELRRRARVNH
jgi:serine/threonine protein kinase